MTEKEIKEKEALIRDLQEELKELRDLRANQLCPFSPGDIIYCSSYDRGAEHVFIEAKNMGTMWDDYELRKLTKKKNLERPKHVPSWYKFQRCGRFEGKLDQ
jgi:hypothetical protein